MPFVTPRSASWRRCYVCHALSYPTARPQHSNIPAQMLAPFKSNAAARSRAVRLGERVQVLQQSEAGEGGGDGSGSGGGEARDVDISIESLRERYESAPGLARLSHGRSRFKYDLLHSYICGWVSRVLSGYDAGHDSRL